jgi:hypothetical protein
VKTAGEHVEQARGEPWVARGEEAHLAGKGEDPLAHRDGWQDVADEVVGSLLRSRGCSALDISSPPISRERSAGLRAR